MGETYLGADLGGTNLRVALISDDGEVLLSKRSATPRSGTASDIAGELAKLAKQCVTEDAAIPTAFGIAIPALVNCAREEIISSPNLPQLNGSKLVSMVADLSGIPVVLENDANAAAIGEHWRGASRGYSNAICVTLGTGIGGGIILDGELWRGSDGTAGEIGHICVEAEGRPCGCGSRGCVEQYASATGIVKTARELVSQLPGSRLVGIEKVTSLDVYNAASDGDELAVEAFRLAGKALGIVVAGLVNTLNPDVVVIGGGASNGWDFFIGATREEVAERAFKRPAERVKLVRASVGDSAGVIGAAKIARGRRADAALPAQ
jgi:glucokinase